MKAIFVGMIVAIIAEALPMQRFTDWRWWVFVLGMNTLMAIANLK